MPYLVLEDDTEAEVIMPKVQGVRLQETCFRGVYCQMAGNLFRWTDYVAFIRDELVQHHLKLKLYELAEKAEGDRQHRIEIEFDHDIGWDSVMDVHDLSDEDLAACERQNLNKNASALFLPDGRIVAPKTNVLTMVLKQIWKDEEWKFFIKTMYPGHDVGRMRGDMTKKAGFVWMHWTNLGEE